LYERYVTQYQVSTRKVREYGVLPPAPACRTVCIIS